MALAAAVTVAGSARVIAGRGKDDHGAILIDERRGVLEGIRFGDRLRTVRARRGEPSDDSQGFFPGGARYTGPPGLPSSSLTAPPTALHYDETAYLVSPKVGVFSMATLREGARTRAGVSIGDRLGRVRERFRRARCGESTAGEPLFGGDPPTYRWCRAIVGHVDVFFGDDPIESITLTRYG